MPYRQKLLLHILWHYSSLVNHWTQVPTVPAKSQTGRACCFGDVSPHPTSAWPGPLNHLYCPHSGRHAGELLDFAEKPTGQDLEKMSHASNAATPELPFEASMGIYVFNKSVLVELLNDPRVDLAKPENHFGHHILPRALREDYRIMSYHFDKYWRVRWGPHAGCSHALSSCMQPACGRGSPRNAVHVEEVLAGAWSQLQCSAPVRHRPSAH